MQKRLGLFLRLEKSRICTAPIMWEMYNQSDY
ncbi:hypothetical protein SAMN05444507_10655 [Pseudomonas syringae]|nr:hypothetical protein SAMN05444507_10655 [Pseudomonas syringae]